MTTETDTARTYNDDAHCWDCWVGEQSPADFLEYSTTDDPEEAVAEYLDKALEWAGPTCWDGENRDIVEAHLVSLLIERTRA